MKTTNRPCPSCDEQLAEVIYHLELVLPDESSLSSEYDVVICETCGFAYADTASTQAAYDRFYEVSSIYEDSKTSISQGITESDRERSRVTAQTIAKNFTDKSLRIADIGCGGGSILSALKELGYKNLLGLDPSAACVRHIQHDLGIEAVQGTLSQAPLQDRQFDLIILSHVLEHLRDFQAVGKVLNRNLANNGHAYLEVPDSARYVDHLASPFQDFNTEHINHFCLETLCAMVHRFQFSATLTGQKDLQLDGWTYPALFGFFKKDPNSNTERPMPSSKFKQSLLRYIDLSNEKLDNIDSQILPHAVNGQPLIVWGTGQLTYKLLARTSLNQATIEAFVDSNPINQRKHIRRVPILPPAELRSSPTPILIGTTLHSESIAKTIREELDLKNPLLFLQSK